MIIGITGLKGAGKDTFGNFICDITGKYTKASFASTLKDVISCLFSWDRELLEGATIESREWREQKDEFWSKELGFDITPRKALQDIGTKVFREHFHKDIWLIAIKRKIQKNKNIIITDVRFPNEIDLIRNQGGIIIRIERGELPTWFNTASNYNCFDKQLEIPMELKKIPESEWKWIGCDSPDLIVKNNGDLGQLREQAFSFVINYLMEKRD